MRKYWHGLPCIMKMTLDQSNEAAAFAVSLSAETIAASKGVNNTLETTGKVKASYGTHYANTELDIYGIQQLVCEILRANESVFSRGIESTEIESTELRHIAIAASMFTSDIIATVNEAFADAGMRYKPQAVKNVLSTYGKDLIVKITLTNNEDQPRPCSKPRAKWYLIQQSPMKNG